MDPTALPPDLLSLWLALLWRRRWPLILAAVVAGFVVAAVVVLWTPPRYASTALVRIGTAYGVGVFDGPRAVAAELEAKYREAAAAADCTLETSFVEPPDALVTLTLECRVAETAAKLVSTAVAPVLEQHAATWDRIVGPNADYQAFLERQLTKLDAADAGNDGDRFSRVLLARELSRELFDARLEADRGLSRPTVLLKTPVPATTPTRPALLLLLLGAAAGLALGVLFAALLQVREAGHAPPPR
ncbi:MAG: hypothetical protein HY903_22390 [Deltaproteobacteria bacterium]|nr:hypothetical protein [Deltaproteobacteria bacterium]